MATHPAARSAATELPEVLLPELATLVRTAPGPDEEWEFELKYDGYRMLARIDQRVQLISRNGNDWTSKLEPLRAELARLQLPRGWYDGEIVVLDKNGRPDFGLLQNAFDRKRVQTIQFFLFDAPFLDGRDIREIALTQRRLLLEEVLAQRESDSVHFSPTLEALPGEVMVAACQMGLEGLIGKRKDSRYVSRRSPEWIKLKCALRQEFVIGGYTDPGGARAGFGSLLLGTFDSHGRLVYAGSVGTGFDAKLLRDIYKQLLSRASSERPFSPHKELTKAAHWVRPDLVAEVSFAEWTHTGSIRHASFRGMRKDKVASTVVREQPAADTEDGVEFRKHHWGQTNVPTKRHPAKAPAKKPVKVTNGNRIIDRASGATKLELVNYYASISELMLPHLLNRPTSLVRAPAGIDGELFFQKHADATKLEGIQQFPAAIHPGHEPMIAVASGAGLLSTAQLNVIEYHTQNATGRLYACPDRMIFDLDPGEGIDWPRIQEAATLVRAVVEHLGLLCFLKTSGGKGLHVVVPIQPRYGWDAVKQLSKAVVVHIASVLPERFSHKSGSANRKQKIFIDYLRNGIGATTACAWSARARPGLGVSVPVDWSELQTLTAGDQWNIGNIGARISLGNEPWSGYSAAAGMLDEAFDVLELRRPKKKR